jgi:hypothetical protein
VIGGDGRIQEYGAGDEGESLVIVAGLGGEDGQAAESGVVGGVERENLVEEPRGFGEAAGLVSFDGRVEGLLNRHAGDFRASPLQI